MTYAAAPRIHELLLVATCSLVLTAACTTSETGVIDLAVASAPKPPAPPMTMMPKPDTMQCMHDMDCMKAAPRCDPMLGLCVECATDADCADPRQPACDLRTEKCVACAGDAGCPMAPTPPPKPPPP